MIVEYDLTRRRDPRRVLYVQIEADIRKDGIHADFDGWYKDFAKRNSFKLEGTRNRTQKVIDKNRRLIRKELSKQIEDALERIYRAISD